MCQLSSKASLAARPAFRKRALQLLLVALSVVTSAPVLAHHPLDGQEMHTFWHGFLSGIAHPVLGMDHLVFILTIGVSAVFARSKTRVAACVMLGVLAGVLLTIAGVPIPNVETLIAISLIMVGVIVLASTVIKTETFQSFDALLVAAVGIFSVLHGSVYALVLVEQSSISMPVIAGFVLALPVIYSALLMLGRAAAIGFERFSYTAFGPARIMPLLSIGLGASLLAT